MIDLTDKLLRNSVAIFGSKVGVKFATAINVLILNGFLTIDEFGALMLAISVIRVLSSISTFSIHNVIFKFCGNHHSNRRESAILSNIFYFCIIISSLWFITYLTLIFVLEDLIITKINLNILVILIVQVMLIPFVETLKAYLIGQGKVGKSAAIEMIEMGSQTIIFLILFILGGTLELVAYAYLLGSIAALLASAIFVGNLSFLLKYPPNVRLQFKILGLSSSLFVSSISSIVLNNLDRIMLGLLTNTTNVGYYSIASVLANILMVGHWAFSSAFKPFVSSAFKTGNIGLIREKYIQIARISIGMNALIFLALNLLSFEVAQLFFGYNYVVEIKPILLALSTGVFLLISAGQSSGLLQMTGGIKSDAQNTIISVAINFGLNWLFIPNFGMLGAAIGTLFTIFVRVTLQVFQIKRVLGFFIIQPFQFIIYLGSISLACIGILSHEISLNMGLFVIAAVFLISYLYKKEYRGAN